MARTPPRSARPPAGDRPSPRRSRWRRQPAVARPRPAPDQTAAPAGGATGSPPLVGGLRPGLHDVPPAAQRLAARASSKSNTSEYTGGRVGSGLAVRRERQRAGVTPDSRSGRVAGCTAPAPDGHWARPSIQGPGPPFSLLECNATLRPGTNTPHKIYAVLAKIRLEAHSDDSESLESFDRRFRRCGLG